LQEALHLAAHHFSLAGKIGRGAEHLFRRILDMIDDLRPRESTPC
jgi:hypothetical protein